MTDGTAFSLSFSAFPEEKSYLLIPQKSLIFWLFAVLKDILLSVMLQSETSSS
jgi:hypothetical protein